MLKYIIVFTIFYLQVFLLSLPVKAEHLQNPIPEDFIMYRSFCEDEDAILRIGQALEVSKEEADLMFFNLAKSERCFVHSEELIGLVIEDVYIFKVIYGIEAIAYKIKTSLEETGYILFMTAAHLGV